MKKHWTLVILTILFVFILTGCGESYSYEETKFQTIVIQCEEGTFHPDSSYMALANVYLAQQNTAMWSLYMNLANTNGKYDYHVVISIEGKNYTVVRPEQYEPGQKITITEVKAYKESELVKTEYK